MDTFQFERIDELETRVIIQNTFAILSADRAKFKKEILALIDKYRI